MYQHHHHDQRACQLRALGEGESIIWLNQQKKVRGEVPVNSTKPLSLKEGRLSALELTNLVPLSFSRPLP